SCTFPSLVSSVPPKTQPTAPAEGGRRGPFCIFWRHHRPVTLFPSLVELVPDSQSSLRYDATSSPTPGARWHQMASLPERPPFLSADQLQKGLWNRIGLRQNVCRSLHP